MYIITQSTWLRVRACDTGTVNQHLPVCHGM